MTKAIEAFRGILLKGRKILICKIKELFFFLIKAGVLNI
jgi:hypothetical protein